MLSLRVRLLNVAEFALAGSSYKWNQNGVSQFRRPGDRLVSGGKSTPALES